MLHIKLDEKFHQLGEPVNCSRKIFSHENRMSQAFSLPKMTFKPFEVEGFTGDVEQGGSCNVRILSFTPHNLTHIETPNHIATSGKTLIDISPQNLSGLGYLLDLSEIELKDGYIYPEHLSEIAKLGNSKLISCLAIKTSISSLPEDHNFTGTDPISLHPETAKTLTEEFPNITLLILDLPSTDKEEDGGKLAAHRNFFGLYDNEIGLEKSIIELAYFEGISSGLYYIVATPSRLDLDAIISSVFLYPIFK